VDKVAGKHGTKQVAQAYLEYLYTDAGQEIAAKHFYRPRLASVAAKYEAQFPKLALITIDEGVRRVERRRRPTSLTERCSIRSTSPGASPAALSTPTKG